MKQFIPNILIGGWSLGTNPGSPWKSQMQLWGVNPTDPQMPKSSEGDVLFWHLGEVLKGRELDCNCRIIEIVISMNHDNKAATCNVQIVLINKE